MRMERRMKVRRRYRTEKEMVAEEDMGDVEGG